MKIRIRETVLVVAHGHDLATASDFVATRRLLKGEVYQVDCREARYLGIHGVGMVRLARADYEVVRRGRVGVA